MLKLLFLITSTLWGIISFSQETVNGKLIEEKFKALTEATDFEQKRKINTELKSTLKKELLKENAFSYPFKELESIITLTPTDSSFRLFSWNIAFADGTYQYECAILKRNSTDLFFLTPRVELIPTNFLFTSEDEDNKLSNVTATKEDWIGALYYQIIQTEGKFNTYYTLLGWDGNDLLTNKKIIDVLWFNQAGEPKFGAPIFKSNTSIKSRIIFEFGGQNTMRLYTIPDFNRIVFDHLSAPPANIKETTQLDGVYDYYGADLSFDALDWENDYWILKSNIDPEETNPKKLDDNPGSDGEIEQKDFISKENVKKVKQRKAVYKRPN